MPGVAEVREALAAVPEPTPPLGNCRHCGLASWLEDEIGPAHPCCTRSARENPGRPCGSCQSGKRRR